VGTSYSAERPGTALGSWFQTPNLSALRELALLWLVGKLASDRRRSRPGGQVLGDGHARERVVVALSGGPEGETLIRRAARIAAWSAGDLLAAPRSPPSGRSPSHSAAPTTSWLTPTSRPRCWRSPRQRTPLSWCWA
jgi:two-component system sensor histidine kinase KdpD